MPSILIRNTIVFFFLGVAPVFAAKQALSEIEQNLVKWVERHQNSMVDELARHVNLNTGTANIAGIDEYRKLLQKDLQQLGFAIEIIRAKPIPTLSCAGGEVMVADHLLARRSGTSKRLWLNGHMDTVFSKDDEFQSLSISPDGLLRGPGVADMKGGIVVMLNALRALYQFGLLKDTNLTVLLNSDEEIGSLDSRPIIEKTAQNHDIGLVFEGSSANRLVHGRKGLGQVRLKVTGRESHAGGAHQQGVSAIRELADKILRIEQLTDYEQQTTVNVGVINGGEKRNTVPGCADAFIDLRYPTAETGAALLAGVKAIADKQVIHNSKFPTLPATEFWGALHRPAKNSDPVVDKLIQQMQEISQITGEPIVGSAYSGGGTDGSIAQAAGLPTIDSLGLNGIGAHSSREQTSKASLVARTKLAAILLYRLLH